ncbi:hypothetical protein PY254_13650 [Rhodanobacter sp. AS-Z3]|uniref:hypothetical protein n=1 Tax=Rhodanobacter sp. AS-Z3 TaxID=3031330 RepID=UPI002478E5CC|nr:hypothetical protein [Rhodanobacter sp. AS-Z3]WEN14276.1 hypothetical protein PY254_13650 [Rhodanobacter sp. AS-Z3]
MAMEAQNTQFEFKQNIIELLWNDGTLQAAEKVVARCTSDEQREHALWMAVAMQRAAVVSALLQAGISASAREAAVSLLCGGLARAGVPAKTDNHIIQLGSCNTTTIDTAVRVGTSRFWFEAEKLMGIYQQQGLIKGDWLVMLPALREGVEPASLQRFIQTLHQANSKEITVALALLQSEINRHVPQGAVS